jgi:hypothetical protein
MKASTRIQSGVSLLAIFLVFAFAGCNFSGNKSKQASTAAPSAAAKEITLNSESQALLNKFPTPFELTLMLEKSQAGFIFNITNPPENVNKYSTEKSRALNLGVYSADLSYSATFKSMDETNKFLACTNKLADELGIAGIYNPSMVEKINQFNNNKDSLISLINKVFSETNDFLSKNNRSQIAVLIATGGFTEAVFIAASLAEFAKDNSKIMAVIASQKENYNKLATILDAYKDDQVMKPVADEIAKLKPIWENYNIASGEKISQQTTKEITVLADKVRGAFVQ